MKLIKINYNNLAIKKPKKIYPEFSCFRRIYLENDNIIKKIFVKNIKTNLEQEPFFSNIFGELYITGTKSNEKILVFYVDNNTKDYTSDSFLQEETKEVIISLEGHYSNKVYNIKQSFEPIKQTVNVTPKCNNGLCCCDELCADETHEGYYEDNTFYLTKNNETGELSTIMNANHQEKYYDKNRIKLYIYDKHSQKYIEL